MIINPGRYQLGPQNGRLLLRTYRQGLAASVGHDLTIEVQQWSADLVVDAELSGAAVTAEMDLGSLTVIEGTGGAMALTADNREEIEKNARKALDVARSPQGTFVSAAVSGTDAAATVEGTLTLHGQSQPVRFDVEAVGAGQVRARGAVVQTAFGIKPYSAFLGALKLKDEVEFELTVTVGS